MNKLVEGRVKGLKAILMAHHAAGQGMANATIGLEREIITRELLARVLPTVYRFGSGDITDSSGGVSGQVDIVIEWPFYLSLPTFAEPRLYVAESVALAVEVKSNLTSQWADVLTKASKMEPLRRRWQGYEQVRRDGISDRRGQEESRIPFMAIGFEGWKSAGDVKDKLKHANLSKQQVDAVFVIGSGVFVSVLNGGRSAEGVEGFLTFLDELSYMLQNVRWARPDLGQY